MPGMDRRAFEKLVGSYGCRIEATSKHHKIIAKDGTTVSYLAIGHGSRQKNIVLPKYIKLFEMAVKELGLNKK